MRLSAKLAFYSDKEGDRRIDLVETKVSSSEKEVIISDQLPTVLIGERINPTGKKRLADALRIGDLELVRAEAIAQVEAGADILDVNVGVAGLDEVSLLPEVVQAVSEVVDVPLCIDSSNSKALEAALRVCRGKALVNSVSGEERSLAEVLPLIKEYEAAVIGLSMDEAGVSDDVDRRVAIAHKIVERAAALGVPAEDVLIDCLVTAVGANSAAGLQALETVRRIKNELGREHDHGRQQSLFWNAGPGTAHRGFSGHRHRRRGELPCSRCSQGPPCCAGGRRGPEP